MDFISEIIGCNLKYNYKPSQDGALELVEQNEDIFSCVRHCSEDCLYGWVYHAGNKKVVKNI